MAAFQLSPAEQKSIDALLEKANEESRYVGRVQVVDDKNKKKGPPEEHVLVISSFRVRLFKKGKVVSDHHLLDIQEIQSASPLEIVFLSKSAILKRINPESAEVCDEILKVLFVAYTTSFPEADAEVIRFTVVPTDRFDQILKRADCTDVGACGGFISTYRSVCSFLGVTPNAVVCWDIDHLYPYNNVVDFDLNEFYQLSVGDLKALLMALAYNHYFKNFYALHYKLGAEGLQQVTDLLVKNLGIEKLDLQYSSCPKEGMMNLFTLLQSKKHSITHFDFSGNVMQTKGLNALAELLKNFDHDLHVLKVNNVSGTVRGMELLLAAIQGNNHIVNSLTTLAFSFNKLDLNTTTYAFGLLASRVTALTTLEMRSTSPVWSLVKNGIPSLTSLDISDNKISIKDNSVDDVLGFLRGCTNLQTLNLNNCLLGPEEIKKLLVDGSPVLRVSSLELADNEYGDEGIITLTQKMYFNSNLRHLSIQGNFKNKSKYRVRALECLTHLIEDNIAIESINISAGAGKSQFKSEILLFLMSLQNNQSLQKLDIRGHGIGDWGAVVLGQVIQGNTTLRTIKCGDNGFGIKGLRLIKSALQRNTTVIEMPLPINDIATILKSDSTAATQRKIQSISRKIQKCLADNLNAYVRGSEGSNSFLVLSPNASPSHSPATSTNNSPTAAAGQLRVPLKHVRSFSGSKEVAQTLGLKGPSTAASVSRWAAKDKGPEKQASSTETIAGVPLLVTKCVNYLMEKGYESVGIFRICASASVLKKLKARLLAGEDIDMNTHDPDTAAGLLKSYYREADQPLYPENTHAPFLAALSAPEANQVAKYAEAFKTLPQPTQAVSKLLFQLMHKISQYAEVNMMNPENISICWAPTLFRSFSTEYITIVQQVIIDYECIFEGKAKVAPAPQAAPAPDEAAPADEPDESDKSGEPSPEPTPKGIVFPEGIDENGEGIVGQISRQSWIPDSPHASAGPRLPARRQSIKAGAVVLPSGRPGSSRNFIANNPKYATMIFSEGEEAPAS
eukprot:Phypoly_transcript_01755.p1 GENE.Phypoly_transcript_01755~~Phypoly_transcript_01755.p1  ORF type:complete len:1015 (-),score=168.51 Phypoly_transcript_01755:36-3080(-)